MSAPIPESTRLPGLDHLRALAITLVFIFHYRLFAHPDWVDKIGSFGWTGVDLFFVLSGYLIAEQIFKGLKAGTFSLGEFFIKRSFRILPAYWTVLALYFFVGPFREWESLPPLWKFLSFTQNFGLDLREHRTFSHAWSLCIEEQFYFLLPFTLMLLQFVKAGRKSLAVLILLFGAGYVFRLISWYHFVAPVIDTDAFGAVWYKWIYYPTYNRLDGLLIGIGIAAITHYTSRLQRTITNHSMPFLFAGFGVLTGAYILCATPTSFGASLNGFPLVALGFGLIVAPFSARQSFINRYPSRITAVVAELSYAIYLTHKAAIHFAQIIAAKLGLDTAGTTAFLMSLLASLLTATILHYIIERPFLRCKDWMLRKKKPTLDLLG